MDRMVTQFTPKVYTVTLVKWDSIFAGSPVHMWETAYFIQWVYLLERAITHLKKQVDVEGSLGFFLLFFFLSGEWEHSSMSYDSNLPGVQENWIMSTNYN